MREKVYDIIGTLQYITKPKSHHIQKDNRYFTYLPKGSKLISCSQKFGTSLDKNFYKEEYITADHLKHILDIHFNEYDSGNGNFVRVDSHNYYDDRKSEISNCWDRVYIRTTKEFIDNNF